QSASLGQVCLARCAPEPAPSDADLLAFERARTAGTAESWDRYLQAFPQGRYAKIATNERGRILAPTSAGATPTPAPVTSTPLAIGVIASPGESIHEIASLARSHAAQPNQYFVVDLPSASQAASVVERLKLQRVAAIINLTGEPVLSAVVNAARAQRIPVLTTVGEIAGDGVYNFARSQADEVESLVVAAVAKGVRRLAVVGPNAPDNVRAHAAFVAARTRLGLPVSESLLYAPGAASSVEAFVRRIGAIDGLIVLDAAADLPALATALERSGVDFSRTRLLGTSVWATSPPRAAVFQGAWFVATGDDAGFEQRARAYMNRSPTPLDRSVYNLMALSLFLSQADGTVSTAAVTRLDGFVGVDGLFRFKSDGRVERRYDLRQIGAQGSTSIITPAAPRFTPATTQP
ncbi:MAG: ABC transporter substrate-binding protein, partial [Parvularculaceae bacterium]